MIVACRLKYIYPIFWGLESRAPHHAPPVSYTYASNMLIVNLILQIL